MTNKLDFYTELISSILDCCCSYIVTLENTAIELLSCYGNNPLDLYTLRLVVNNFDSTKKSFSIIDIKDFKNTLENESFISKNLDSIGYLPILDKNKIAIGYLITSFDKPFSILENQEKTIGLLSNKIFEKLRKEEKEEDSHIGNSELLSQTDQKAKLVAELIKANKELAFQNAEKEKRANELFIANQELVLQNQEQEKRAAELLIANLEIDFLHREEHALFASIVDSSEDAMLSKRLDGIITSWNHGAEKIFGYSADEIIGKSILTLIPPQLQHQEASIIEKIKNGETVSNLKTERLRKDGTIFYAAITISPIKNFDGNIIGASKVLQDISERKQIEEALQEKERKLVDLTNNINESSLISITDEKGTIIEINRLFCELSGYTKAELVGQNHRIINSGYHDKEFWLDMWKTIAKGEIWRGEIKNRAKDGSEYWVASVINPVKDHNGKIIQYISIRQDITERKIAEEKIKNNERQLNVIYNTVSDSFFMLSIEDQNRFKFISVNSTFLKTTGLNEEQIIGQYVHNVIPMPSLLMVLEKYNEAITGRSSVSWEETSVYPSGTKTGFVTVSPVIDEKNNCTILVGSVRDITERKRAEEKITESENRMRLVTSSAEMGIWYWDNKNDVMVWDKKMYQIYDINESQLGSVYDGWLSRLHPEDRDRVHEVMQTAIADKKREYNSEFRIIWDDLSVHYIKGTGITEYDENGNVIQMMGVNWDITPEKEIEAEKNQLTKRLLLATQSAQMGIWDWDLETNTLKSDEGMYKLYGIASEDFNSVYDGWMSIIHDEDRQRVADELQLAVSNKKDYNTEFRVVWNDSSIHFIKATGTVSRDDVGNAIRMIGVNWDITTEKEIELENKELTKRLLLATQSAQIGIWDWDIKNNLLTWDEGMYRLYSVAANEFPSVYEGWFSRLHPDDREKVQDVIDLALANKKDYNPEFRIVWGDSSVHYINASGIIERDNDGNAIRMIGVNWDITEQKEKEQHLKLLESVITNTTDSILITEAEPFDEPGPRILYVNEAFTKMTGYTAADVIGKTPRILQGPKSDRAELKRLSEAIRKWESCEISTINYKKNGEEFWINCTLTPVANEKGWYTHWIAIERDVTVRKNEELQNKLIADISSIFSEPLKLYETLDRALRFISNFGDFCFAEAWLTSSDQNILKKISSHAATENSRLFLEETISVDTSIDGDGFTGAVAKTREITIWGDLANQKLLRRRDAAVKYGLKTILGLPLLYNNELVGVLAFGLDHELVENNKYLSIFKKLGDYLGPEIKRKQLELELNQMFNFAPDLIIIIGLDGCFNRVNPAASQLLGYTQQELCAEPYVNFIHPEDREKSANEIASLLETNVTYYFENRYMTKSGKIKWLAWNGIYVAEDNSIYAVAKDITDKKELENLFKKTNELARIGGWEVDLQNNTILWSDITREILEVAPDYIPDVQTRIDFYKKGSDRNKIAEYLDQAINTGKSWDDEFQIVTAKGNERWVRNIGEAEFVNGNCVRIFGSFQDIDKRKKAELKLIENENYLRTILDNEPECVKVLNSEGELVSMNPAGLTMIEADNEQQVVGQRMTNLVNKEYQIGFSQLSASVFKGNPGTFEFEITGLKGSQRWLETHAVPLKDTTGKIVNLLGVTRDITERKANESKLILLNENLNEQKAELVTSNKELEQFAYVASHDLQEPLRMVTSFLTLLEKRYIGVLDEKGLSYINFAVDGAKRMRQIILDILEFSRINTNDDGNYESVDLKEIIDEISLLQSKLIKEKKAKIIFEERSDVYSVRHYLMQLFQNIISNALKYSKEDIPLQIIIKSEEFDDFYQIAITDNGIGIEQEYFEKIFIIFQRLHGKEKYDGNGMGLAIVKKIVDKLNGKIWVESQVDVGSTFYINIPKKIR